MKKLVFKNTLEHVLHIDYSKFGCLIDINSKSVRISTTEDYAQSKDFVEKFIKVIPNSKGCLIGGFEDSTIVQLNIEHPNYSFKMEDYDLYVVTGNYGWELC